MGSKREEKGKKKIKDGGKEKEGEIDLIRKWDAHRMENAFQENLPSDST